MVQSNNLDAALQQAVGLQQAGRLAEAAQLYQAILAQKPSHAEALHWFGMLNHQLGDKGQALNLLRKAIKKQGKVGLYHYHLGLVLAADGKLDEAAMAYERALTLRPDLAAAANNLGAIRVQQGRAEAALRALRKAVKLQPGLAEANKNLGNALIMAGDLEAAVAAYRTAMGGMPRDIELRNNFAHALMETGDTEQALRLLGETLEAAPDNAAAHNLKGAAFKLMARDQEARAAFKRALELDPDCVEALVNLAVAEITDDEQKAGEELLRQALAAAPDNIEALTNLGSLLTKSGRPDEAIAPLEHLARLQPNDPARHIALASTLRLAHREQEAAAALRQAVKLAPGDCEAMTLLGDTLLDAGDIAQAHKLFRNALAQCPDEAGAYVSLTVSQKITAAELPLLQQMESLLTRCAARDDAEAEVEKLHFALGKGYNDLGDYERAFQHYAAGNRIAHRHMQFDRGEHTAQVDGIIATCDRRFFAARREFGSDSRRPIFILGMPRSGTTLTEQILASHSQVFGADELIYWSHQAQELGTGYGALDVATVKAMAAGYLEHLAAIDADSRHVTDKMPGNFMHLSLIHLAFPQARIVHCLRNPVDTCLSVFFQSFSGHHPYAYDLDDLAFYYREYRRLMAHWRETLPADVFMELQYEELLAEPEATARRLLAFCDLDWEPACLEFHRSARSVRTASRWQVRQPLYNSSRERWRHYAAHLGPLLPLLEAQG